jgi:NAD(P)-dependent dehydrogenase (short-subunit alcohol dehydrogenase family)
MMRQGWGRIVNVRTSLGTMLNAGSPTYGPSKAALEALSTMRQQGVFGVTFCPLGPKRARSHDDIRS